MKFTAGRATSFNITFKDDNCILDFGCKSGEIDLIIANTSRSPRKHWQTARLSLVRGKRLEAHRLGVFQQHDEYPDFDICRILLPQHYQFRRGRMGLIFD
jgi:hypothetical protein